MEQVLFGGFYNTLSATVTEYNSLNSGNAWYSTANYNHQVVSTDGIIKSLRLRLSAAPGAGKHYDFTLMLNGAPTALTVEIADAAVDGNDMVHEIDVAPGDYINLECDPDNSPTAVYATWSSVFEGDTANESLILGTTRFPFNSGATEYGQISTPQYSPSVTENDFRQVVPTAGTIKNFYVKLNIDPGTAPDAYRFTVRLNGATDADSPIVTITANDTTGSDLVNELDVVAGDILTMMIEPLNGPSATPYGGWGLTFVADTDGESIVLAGSSNDLSNTVTEYNYLNNRDSNSWSATENQRYQLGQVCTVEKLYVLLSGTPGVGNKYDVYIRIAGADSNVIATVDGLNTTGNSGALEDDVALDEYVNMKVDPDSVPTTRDAYWGFVCFIEPAGVETFTKTFTFDALLQKELTKTFTFDGYLQKSLTKEFTFDGMLKLEKTKTFTLDGWLQKAFTKTFTFDAWLLKEFLKAFTFDALLQKEYTKTFTFDGWLQKAFAKTFTLDALLQKTLTQAFTFDALLQKELTKGFTFDALLEKLTTKTFTFDALLQKTLTKTFTFDGVLALEPVEVEIGVYPPTLRIHYTASMPMLVPIRRPVYATIRMNRRIRRAILATVDMESLIRRRFTESFDVKRPVITPKFVKLMRIIYEFLKEEQT